MKATNEINVWDLPLRVFHWLLAAGFLIAYVTEDELLSVHVGAGYLIVGLLLFRLIWGFFGSRYARFSNFVCTPRQSIRYIKALLTLKGKRHIGHNPAGAAMIVLLLISLTAACITGFAVYGAEQAAGPFAAIGSRYEKLWEEMHEFFANFTLILVALHVLGVLTESYIHKENLIKAMWNGRKKTDSDFT